MILIDSNIPMYLIGANHPHKREARRILEDLIDQSVRLVTDAEVFQEIIHRYVVIKRREAIQPAFDLLMAISDEIFPIEDVDVIAAKDLLGSKSELSSRDALHLAIMKRQNVETIFSFDHGFDSILGINRIPG